MEKLMELRVYLRDLIGGAEALEFNQVDWVDQHNSRIAAAMDTWLGTFGGTILITGTPEYGRVTVYRRPSDPNPIIDFDWYTQSLNP